MTTLPDPVAKAVSGYKTDGKNIKSHSASEVYRYVDTSGDPALFLKVQPPSWSPPLSREKDAMIWLAGNVVVPEVVAYVVENEVEYLVATAIPGVSSEHETCHDDKQRLVEQLAAALHTIQDIPMTGCPFDKTADDLIAWGRTRIAVGIITQKMVEEEGLSGTPEEALEDLESRKPAPEGPVTTHGDYCLPNIMIHNERVSGFIDLGYLGIGDPYRDFIAAQYSVRRNLGEEWIAPFFDAYGVESLDEQKLRWYRQIQAFD